MKTKQSIEDQEDLLDDIIRHPGISILLTQLDVLIGSLNDDVLKLNMTGPDAERELVYRRLRADGAAKLAAAFKSRVNTLKLKKAKG